jgi:hypothetical protein
MQLNLTGEQAQALILAIDSYYSDLREEIYHTDDYDTRQSLKAVEQALEQIREALEPGWAARTGASADDGAPSAATAPVTPASVAEGPTTPPAAG